MISNALLDPETQRRAQEARKTAKQAKALTDRQEKRLSQTPKHLKSFFKAAFDGSGSLRNAIKAQCLDCNGLERATINECAATTCPLWRYRPYQRKG